MNRCIYAETFGCEFRHFVQVAHDARMASVPGDIARAIKLRTHTNSGQYFGRMGTHSQPRNNSLGWSCPAIGAVSYRLRGAWIHWRGMVIDLFEDAFRNAKRFELVADGR